MLIKTTVKASSDGTLEGKFNGFPVTVRADHQRSQEVTGITELTLCVIGMDCAMKQLDCSTLPHFRPPYRGSADLLAVQIGHAEKNCVVKKLERGGFVIDIPGLGLATGIVAKAHVEPELRQLAVGAAVTARIMDYNLMDNTVAATTLARLLAQAYFSVHQARLGELVSGTVKRTDGRGCIVQISSRLTGLIPLLHLSDKPLVRGAPLSSTHKAGDTIACRVFHVDRDENRLLLTARKSLMTSKLTVVGGFADLCTDQLLSGFVAKVLEFGLVVSLFGNLRVRYCSLSLPIIPMIHFYINALINAT